MSLEIYSKYGIVKILLSFLKELEGIIWSIMDRV